MSEGTVAAFFVNKIIIVLRHRNIEILVLHCRGPGIAYKFSVFKFPGVFYGPVRVVANAIEPVFDPVQIIPVELELPIGKETLAEVVL
jgi:hypothetical protein